MKKIIFSISLFIILMFGSSGVEGMSELDNLVNSTSENIEHSAALATDGDYNTYWEANETENQSLLIDLEEVREINSVVQIFNQEDIWYFVIEGSLDNVNYFTLLDANCGIFGATFEEGATGYARYIRLTVFKSEMGFYPSSKEFYVNSRSLSEGKNLAYMMDATASTYSVNYEASKAVDGDTGTYYCASNGNYPQELTVSLSNNNYVKNVNLMLQDYGVYEIELLGIDNNGNETTLLTKTKKTGTYVNVDVNKAFSKIKFKIYSGPGWANLVELQVMGYEILNEIDNVPHYIHSIENPGNVELSKDGVTYIKYNSEEFENSDKVFNYIRNNGSCVVYGYSLNRVLSMGLGGKTSDYLDEGHNIKMATLNSLAKSSQNKYYSSTPEGNYHFIKIDLGRKSIIDSINLEFVKNQYHAFKVSLSNDGKTYKEIANDEITGTKYSCEVLEVAQYVMFEFYTGNGESVELKSLEIIGNGSPKPENWWQNESGVIRFYPKLQHVTLREITSRLDEFRYSGYKIIELHQPYEGLADIWAGLGGTNNYQVDPTIGTLDDLANLLELAHEKGMYVFMFGNVGYGKYNADYFKKACKDYALGIDSKERNWFVFSDKCPDPTKWFWSETANAYYYGYWGENGKIPTFNFDNKEWQDETSRYISFWVNMGIDGVALDAPDVYYWGQANSSEVTYNTITNTLRKNNLFSLPEGSGNTGFISNFYYSGVQNYNMSSWGGGAQSLGINAARNNSAKGVDDNIKPYRDAAVSLGGISIAGMNFEANYHTATDNERMLEAALVTTTGHLAFLHLGSADYPGQDLMLSWSDELRAGVASTFAVSNSISALNPSGARFKLQTQNDDKYYAFYRSNMQGGSKSIVVFNYSLNDANVQIDLRGTAIQITNGKVVLYDALNNETVIVTVVDNIIQLPVSKASCRILMVK